MAKAPAKVDTSTFMTSLLTDFEKKDDTGEYISFGDQESSPSYLEPRIYFRSGLTLLDILMGSGDYRGIGSGRMTELFGQNRTGKSALAMAYAHQALMDHGDVHTLYVDMERALSKERIKPYPMFGSNRFSVVCPTSLDLACELVLKALRRARENNARMFIVFDSVASMRANSELTAEAGKVVMMAQAQMLSKELPKIRGILSKTDSHLLMLNQMRDKQATGNMPPPDHTPGGKAIQFYADYRIKTANAGKYSLAGGTVIPTGKAASGLRSKIQSVKNKMGIPERSVFVPLIYFPSQGRQSGLSELWSLFHAFKDTGAMTQKSGGQYKLRDDTEWFTRHGWSDYLRKHTNPEGSEDRYTGPLPAAIEHWRKAVMDDSWADGNSELDGGEPEEEEGSGNDGSDD